MELLYQGFDGLDLSFAGQITSELCAELDMHGAALMRQGIRPGERPEKAGLYFMDVVPDGEALWGFPNINDNSEILEMIASGSALSATRP